jgi:hypothetical protein
MRVAHEQAGLVLIELMVALAALTAVLSATLLTLELAEKIAPRDQERANAVHEAQVGLDAMVRELRQASAVNGTTPNYMDVNVTRGGQSVRVRYDCNNPRCVREQLAPDGAVASERVVVERLLNGTPTDPVFAVSPADEFPPTYVKAKVKVPAKGGRQDGYQHSVVLDDGFHLRNVSLGR